MYGELLADLAIAWVNVEEWFMAQLIVDNR